MGTEIGTPPLTAEEALAEAVSDSLAATTEGTDYAEAPVPSDEPGSPYVMRLTHELQARGVAARSSTPLDDGPGLREALENDVLPWLDADRGVTRDDVVKRLRKVLAWTALTGVPAPLDDGGLDAARLRAALEETGFEPPDNICKSCLHHGGDHDLGNWCLVCPRRTVVVSGFEGRIAAGWDYFTSMTEDEKWAHSVGALAETLRNRE
jgi:hypothetical protein